ncbi:response regulator transcription factor [Candidatus Methylospira mobilis]|uniref:response regulator transcription factor n=1 Tax=Candidatus Methylospira mobilis TaxID=1808979 RepID=UPI001D17BE1B|nr:response regulator [Candidatus Methylospira mobilis]
MAVVDDDEIVLNAIKRLLRVCGFRTETSSSGRAFLDALDNHIPDCVLLDLLMPGLNGWDVQAGIAASGLSIPVVFITGDGDPAIRERIAADGRAALLRKPFTERELLETINAIGIQNPKQDGRL